MSKEFGEIEYTLQEEYLNQGKNLKKANQNTIVQNYTEAAQNEPRPAVPSCQVG